jgi:DNA adenine methylase
MTNKIKPAFPYFGSKRRVADIIWSALGQVANYIEPFAGSLSVLLANPSPSKIETVNDINHFLTNFWRAVSQDPQGVMQCADFPVHEAELHARHQWLLLAATPQFRQQMEQDPSFYDVKMAGYWVYGVGASIGNNWLQDKGLKASPLLSSAGGGIHGLTYDMPEQFSKLQQRLRQVRVCCGDWKRIITPSVTYSNVGISPQDFTAVVLDPPYSLEHRDKVYQDDTDIFHEVCQWAIDNGDRPQMRIVVCGYQGDITFPSTWKEYAWQGSGMGNRVDDRGKSNSKREMLWFSPHCLEVK